ncbi:hypothetical protein [Actinomadura geliboluensis]|uniref:hypothetical protein n=1 Tax=Actinomadura geliboluensis TaxID=882440 RepID=UPI00369FDDFE
MRTMELGSLIVACVAVVVSIVTAIYAHQQASSAQDSAASAVSQAQAANEQVSLTEKQLALSERIRREQNEPYVVVDVQNSSAAYHVLNLVVENIGTTIARDVRIDFNPPLYTVNEQNHGFPIGDSESPEKWYSHASSWASDRDIF